MKFEIIMKHIFDNEMTHNQPTWVTKGSLKRSFSSKFITVGLWLGDKYRIVAT